MPDINALTKLASIDLRRVATHLPRDVRSVVKENRLFVAGGFLRSTISGEKVSDIDIFGPNKDLLHKTAMGLALSRKGRMHETDNAYTVLAPGRTPVQFTHRWLYDDPSRLIQEFDFTIARAVVWWRDGRWRSLCDQDFYQDLAARRLVYRSPVRDEDVGGSLMRARKFLRAGYFISAENLGLVVARLCSGIDLEKCANAGLGVDTVIISKLREVDPLFVIDGFDSADEHDSQPVECLEIPPAEKPRSEGGVLVDSERSAGGLPSTN